MRIPKCCMRLFLKSPVWMAKKQVPEHHKQMWTARSPPLLVVLLVVVELFNWLPWRQRAEGGGGHTQVCLYKMRNSLLSKSDKLGGRLMSYMICHVLSDRAC